MRSEMMIEIFTWSHELSVTRSENTDEDNGADNDNDGCYHWKNQVDIGEKVLQSFHELILIRIRAIPGNFTSRGNSTYKNIVIVSCYCYLSPQLTSSNGQGCKLVFSHRKSSIVVSCHLQVVPFGRIQIQNDKVSTGFDT